MESGEHSLFSLDAFFSAPLDTGLMMESCLERRERRAVLATNFGAAVASKLEGGDHFFVGLASHLSLVSDLSFTPFFPQC